MNQFQAAIQPNTPQKLHHQSFTINSQKIQLKNELKKQVKINNFFQHFWKLIVGYLQAA